MKEFQSKSLIYLEDYDVNVNRYLTYAQIQKIIEASNEEMRQAIQAGGSTVRSYIDANGHKGNMQNSLKVYGKEGTPCPRCGTEIEKIKVGGRGTHFCPKCQVIK